MLASQAGHGLGPVDSTAGKVPAGAVPAAEAISPSLKAHPGHASPNPSHWWTSKLTFIM